MLLVGFEAFRVYTL